MIPKDFLVPGPGRRLGPTLPASKGTPSSPNSTTSVFISGHLHVKGREEKMSKSLKNYVTIKVAMMPVSLFRWVPWLVVAHALLAGPIGCSRL